MNCPMCLKFNMHCKIISLPGIYVCEEESCTFCETKESFDMEFNAHVEVPTNEGNSKSLDLEENLFIEHNLNISSHHGKNSIVNGNVILRSINNVNSDFIDNISPGSKPLVDVQFDNFSSIDNFTCKLTCDNSNNTIDENCAFNNPNSNSGINTISENLEIIDLSEELRNYHKFDKTFHKTKKETKDTKIKIDNNLKHNVIDPSISVDLDSSFYHNNNKLFNWLRMPYFMKTHSKIVRILLLHLDVFKFKDKVLFDEIKREYSICETLANQFRIDTVKPLFFKFLNLLYNIIDKTPNNNLKDKEMDERVLCLLYRLFEKYDLNGTLKYDYVTELSCSFCSDNRVLKSKDYILNLELNKFRVKVQRNKLIYDVNCLKCKKISKKTILFKRVPEFVIFHCPKGLKEDITKYENKIVTDDNRKLSIVSIVQCGSKYPFNEAPENQLNWEIYDINDVTMDNRFRPSYFVHFRNKNGWYSLNGYKQFLCNPQETLPKYALSDIRFIVFGVVSDPQVYRQRFSLQELIDDHETFSRVKIIEFSKMSLNIQNKPVTKKVINKKSNSKSRPKRKLNKCIKKEENIEQFTEILKPIDLNGGNENIVNEIMLDESILTSTQLPNYFISNSPDSSVLNFQTGNISIGNTSSDRSSISSLLDKDNLRFSRKRKINDLLSQSTSSFSSNISPRELKSTPQNAVFSIDDLITKKSRKINRKCIK